MGFAVCAHTFVRINLYQLFEKAMERERSYVVIPQMGMAMGLLLQIRMSWLRFRKGVGAGAGVGVLGAGAVSWLSVRLRRVRWLCRLRTFLFQPVACQQVVGFCLAIWVYAGVIFFWAVDFTAGGLVVHASTSPTKRLALNTDIGGDAHRRTCINF